MSRRNPNQVRTEDLGGAEVGDADPFGPGAFDDEGTADGEPDHEHGAPLCHPRPGAPR